jgi:hypothetical protein
VFELLGANDYGALVEFSIAAFDGWDADVAFPPSADARWAVTLNSAIADGFTDAVLMPPIARQQQGFAQLVDRFATRNDWDTPYVEVSGLAPAQRPINVAYALLLHTDPRTDDDLRGLTAPALRKALGSHASLTVNEYLIVQNLMFQRFGDHRFDDYSADPSGWMWLADSTDGALTAMGYWNSSKQRIEVTACKTGSKNPRKGARRCRIVALDTQQ